MLKALSTAIAFLFIAPTFLFWLAAEVIWGADTDQAPYGDDDASWRILLSGVFVYALVIVMVLAVLNRGGTWIGLAVAITAAIIVIRFIPAKGRAIK